MIVTTDVTGAPVAINPDRVEGLTVAAGVSPASVLVRTQREAFVLPGTVADVAALLPSSGGAPSGPAGGALAGTYPNPTLSAGTLAAIQALIDAAVSAAVDASGYGPAFVPGPGINTVVTFPANLQTTRVGNLVTITGTMRVDTNLELGFASGPIGTFTLPATSVAAASGGAINHTNADPSDIFPVLGISVLAGGVVAEINLFGISPGFVADFGVSLTIRV